MAEHTPGPWKLEGDGRIVYVDAVSDRGEVYDQYICEVDPDAQLLFSESEFRANARIIAAAPVLLEESMQNAQFFHALIDLGIELPGPWDGVLVKRANRTHAAINMAIAKTEGKQ